MTRTARRLTLPAFMLAGTLALTACGSSEAGSSGPGHDTGTMSESPTPSASGTAASGPHNAADVTFATGMIPHHGQAIDMAQMALEKASNPGVMKLAEAIRAAQDPEIAQMSGWLTGWGEPVPSRSMSGMDMDSMDMGGMMSEQDMSRLENATGAEFDRMWLTMMVQHHRGAVAMAKTELREGQNEDAKQLARAVVDAQSKEIATMSALLETLAG